MARYLKDSMRHDTAGIGKSRLAEEMLDWGQPQGYASASSRSYAMQGALTYAPDRVEGQPTLIVGTIRTEDAVENEALAAFVEAVRHSGWLNEIQLGLLSATESAELATITAEKSPHTRSNPIADRRQRRASALSDREFANLIDFGKGFSG